MHATPRRTVSQNSFVITTPGVWGWGAACSGAPPCFGSKLAAALTKEMTTRLLLFILLLLVYGRVNYTSVVYLVLSVLFAVFFSVKNS